MYKQHDVVVLRQDLPDYGLSRGDVGTVVGVYEEGGYEVEFAAAQGDTVAVVTLSDEELRPIGRREIFAVRELRGALQWEGDLDEMRRNRFVDPG